MLLPHKSINLIIQIPDLEIAQARLLDLRHLPRYFLQDLPAPFFARGDAGLGGYEFGAPRPAHVDDAQGGGLLRPEAEEHALCFFGVAGLGRGLVGLAEEGGGGGTCHDCGRVRGLGGGVGLFRVIWDRGLLGVEGGEG